MYDCIIYSYVSSLLKKLWIKVWCSKLRGTKNKLFLVKILLAITGNMRSLKFFFFCELLCVVQIVSIVYSPLPRSSHRSLVENIRSFSFPREWLQTVFLLTRTPILWKRCRTISILITLFHHDWPHSKVFSYFTISKCNLICIFKETPQV